MPDSLYTIVNELKNINSTLSSTNYDWITTSISTLAGVLVGGYISYYYQNKGTLNFYLNSLEFSFSKRFDSIGFDIRNVKVDEQPENGQIFLDIDIINRKLVTENIRNISLLMIAGSITRELKLYDLSTHEFIAHQHQYDEFKISNIAAKTVSSYKLKGYLKLQDIELLLKNPKIFLKYNNQKNKLQKKFLEHSYFLTLTYK